MAPENRVDEAGNLKLAEGSFTGREVCVNEPAPWRTILSSGHDIASMYADGLMRTTKYISTVIRQSLNENSRTPILDLDQ